MDFIKICYAAGIAAGITAGATCAYVTIRAFAERYAGFNYFRDAGACGIAGTGSFEDKLLWDALAAAGPAVKRTDTVERNESEGPVYTSGPIITR